MVLHHIHVLTFNIKIGYLSLLEIDPEDLFYWYQADSESHIS